MNKLLFTTTFCIASLTICGADLSGTSKIACASSADTSTYAGQPADTSLTNGDVLDKAADVFNLDDSDKDEIEEDAKDLKSDAKDVKRKVEEPFKS